MPAYPRKGTRGGKPDGSLLCLQHQAQNLESWRYPAKLSALMLAQEVQVGLSLWFRFLTSASDA